jgi:hypothetical protein
MQRKTKLWIILIACFFAILYIVPLIQIFMLAPRPLPQTNAQTQVLAQIPQGVGSGPLWHVDNFTTSQFTNADFPASITCGLGESSCQDRVPPARIRTGHSRNRSSLLSILIYLYMPAKMIFSVGICTVPFIALIVLIGTRPLIRKRFGKGANAILAVLVLLFIGLTALATLAPGYLSRMLAPKRPILWKSSTLGVYTQADNIVSGFTTYGEAIYVVNGSDAPVDLYANGLWVDQLPARTYRAYAQYQSLTRLTSLDAGSGKMLDDLSFPAFAPAPTGAASKAGLLVYNIQQKDSLWVENPPSYR